MAVAAIKKLRRRWRRQKQEMLVTRWMTFAAAEWGSAAATFVANNRLFRMKSGFVSVLSEMSALFSAFEGEMSAVAALSEAVFAPNLPQETTLINQELRVNILLKMKSAQASLIFVHCLHVDEVVKVRG